MPAETTDVYLELAEEASDHALHRCTVLERRGMLLAVECGADLDLRSDMNLRVYWDQRGSFMVQDARLRAVSAPPAPRRLEVELIGEAQSADERGSLRVSLDRTDLLAQVGLANPAPVIDLSEVAFSLCAPEGWQIGDVHDAVLYAEGEGLSGRVRVQSAQRTEPGVCRYGLRCLDGLLKFALAGVLLSAQRDQIARTREQRTRRA